MLWEPTICPSELLHSENFLHFYTPNLLPIPPTPPPHRHSLQLFVFLFARCLRFKGLGNLCSHLDWDTEVSCSHAVDVERNRARFFSMCHWALKQNVQDVLWLPRIPGDIIIPSLSFLSPPPSASALTLLYPTLVFMCHSTWSTARTL